MTQTSEKNQFAAQRELVDQGVALLNQGQNDKALSVFELAIKAAPQFYQLLYGKALALAHLGCSSEASQVLKELLQHFPKHAKAAVLLHDLNLKSEEAVPEMNGSHGISTINTVDFELSEQMKGKVNLWIDRGLQRLYSVSESKGVQSVQRLVTQAVSELKRKNNPAAESIISQALAFGSAVRDLHFVHALILVAKKELTAAKQALEREVEHFPDNQAAQDYLQAIRLDLGESSTAAVSIESKQQVPAKEKIKFLQVHGFYDQYIAQFYQSNPELVEADFEKQMAAILEDGFAAPQLYAPYMSDLGYQSHLIIGNCPPAQAKWCLEYGCRLDNPQQWKLEITKKQIDYYKPDVLYLGDCVNEFDATLLRALSHKPKLVIGWRAATIPDGIDWTGFDVMLSGLTELRNIAPSYGVKEALDFYPGYPDKLNKYLAGTAAEYDVSFCGQWTTSQHPQRNYYLSKIAECSAMNKLTAAFYLSGELGALPPVVANLQKGSRFGVGMHKALLSGRITFDSRGIIGTGQYHKTTSDLAKKETTNMRLFEATGCGAFLLTEYRDNLSKYFEVGKEIEAFSDEKELFEKIEFYLQHQQQRLEIAERGKQRCLSQHSMTKRAAALDQVIKARLPQDSVEPGLVISSIGQV